MYIIATSVMGEFTELNDKYLSVIVSLNLTNFITAVGQNCINSKNYICSALRQREREIVSQERVQHWTVTICMICSLRWMLWR